MITLKRCIDVTLVLITAPLTLPLSLAVAVSVRGRLGAPILFCQRRPGLQGEAFQMIKFRTMLNACDESGRLLPDGARLTTFGRWMRTTSLDELPELWNVLKGEMSLVGPRPLLMDYLPRYSDEQARRHLVLPGLTGLAQVRGRNALDWEERLALDVWYVDHRSIMLDLQILSKTLLRVLNRKGINAPGSDTMGEFMGSPKVTPVGQTKLQQ